MPGRLPAGVWTLPLATPVAAIPLLTDALPEARKAMMELARAFEPDELARQGFSLYEQFRPQIPEGVGRWGAKGELDLGRIRKLAAQERRGGQALDS